jgi:hypothetical protein
MLRDFETSGVILKKGSEWDAQFSRVLLPDAPGKSIEVWDVELSRNFGAFIPLDAAEKVRKSYTANEVEQMRAAWKAQVAQRDATIESQQSAIDTLNQERDGIIKHIFADATLTTAYMSSESVNTASLVRDMIKGINRLKRQKPRFEDRTPVEHKGVVTRVKFFTSSDFSPVTSRQTIIESCKKVVKEAKAWHGENLKFKVENGRVTARIYDKETKLGSGRAVAWDGVCFNEWIGKAIAYYRAAGIKPPKAWLEAPEPYEYRAGQIVEGGYKVISHNAPEVNTMTLYWANYHKPRILDDTNGA